MKNDKEYAESYWKKPDNGSAKLVRYILSKQSILKDSLQIDIDRYKKKLPSGTLTAEEVKILRNRIEKKHKYTEYSKYTQMYSVYIEKRRRVSYEDALFLCLLLSYWEYEYEVIEKYIEITEISYESIYEYTREETESIIEETEYTFVPTQNMSAYGASLSDMLDAHSEYRMRKLLQQVMIDTAQRKDIDLTDPAYRHILKQAQMELMGVSGKGNFFGVLDRARNFELAKVRIDALKKAGVEKVRFIAILDNATTDECRDLHGRVFRVENLIIGKNMPPIYPPPHPCRSVVRPLKT